MQTANSQLFRDRIYLANACWIFDAITQKRMRMMFNLIALGTVEYKCHFIIGATRNICIIAASSKSNFAKTSATSTDNTHEGDNRVHTMYNSMSLILHRKMKCAYVITCNLLILRSIFIYEKTILEILKNLTYKSEKNLILSDSK